MVKYYAVTCKCGHADSKNKCIYIVFPIMANSKKEAAEKGKNMPRVKHNHKDCIKDVDEISEEEYEALMEINKKDPYLHVHNIQEQRKLGIDDRFVDDLLNLSKSVVREAEQSRKQVYLSKTKIKHPKKYARNIYWEDSYGNLEPDAISY